MTRTPLWQEAVQGVLLLLLIFGSLLWCHRYSARRWWKKFGEAIR